MKRYIKNGISILCFLCSFGFAASALAGGVYVAPAQPYFDGFYMGLGGGIVGSTANVKTDYTLTSQVIELRQQEPDLSNHQDMDLGKHGVNGNVFIGFGKTLKHVYYLGLEIFGNIFSPKMKSSSDYNIEENDYIDINADVKSRYSFGGDIRFGYLVFPRVMLYALIGADYAKFDVDSSATVYPPGVDSVSHTIDNDFNKWKLGVMPGVGVEVGLGDHVSLRAQYTYTFYPSFDESEGKSFIVEDLSSKVDLLNNHTLKTKVDPERSLFTLKLSYLFN